MKYVTSSCIYSTDLFRGGLNPSHEEKKVIQIYLKEASYIFFMHKCDVCMRQYSFSSLVPACADENPCTGADGPVANDPPSQFYRYCDEGDCSDRECADGEILENRLDGCVAA